MNVCKIVVAGPEREYLRRLSQYTLRPGQSRSWVIKSFTQKEHLDQWLSDGEHCDVLAVDAEWVKEGDWLAPEGAVLLHASGASSAEKGGRRWKIVRKYQPIPQLLAELAEAGSGRDNTKSFQLARQDRNCEVIAFYSPVGGSGKTTAALHYVKHVLKRTEKTLYVNLELFQAPPVCGKSGEEDISGELLYRIKTESDELMQHLERAIRFDPVTQAFYLPSFWHMQNRLELGRQETGKLLDLLVASGRYDRIVLDLDSAPHESTITALEKSDRIYWLLLDDVRCLEKTRLALSILSSQPKADERPSIEQKCCFVLNKYTGELANDFAKAGLHLSGTLPYIPQWKSIHDPKEWMGAGVFSQALHRLKDAPPYGQRGEQDDRTGTG